jgi:uncharacterized membrane protein YdjX (TVP38/TMEM64 family)
MAEYAKIFAIVFGVNLIPAFGPPTWSILVLYVFHSDVPVAPLVLVSAIAAALGRFALAYAFRYFGDHLSDKTKRNLAAAREALERKRRHTLIGVALFALSPVPSAQLFEAAGLARVRLVPFTVAFFIGRLVSYSFYVSTASQIEESGVGDEFQRALTSPLGIAIQVGMLLLLVLFLRINWEKHLKAILRRG